MGFIRKDAAVRLHTFNRMLAICHLSHGEYEQMKYYIIIRSCDVLGLQGRGYGKNGIFVGNSSGHYDYYDLDLFKQYFTLVDSCKSNSHVEKALSYLRLKRNFKIDIIPRITCDGFFYEYAVNVSFPFNTHDENLVGFGSYTQAAKESINLARKATLEKHGCLGVAHWLSYAVFGKG